MTGLLSLVRSDWYMLHNFEQAEAMLKQCPHKASRCRYSLEQEG